MYEGWWPCSASRWFALTGLTRRQQEAARKRLNQHDFCRERVWGYLAKNDCENQQQARIAQTMAKAMELYCSGIEGQLFNRPGRAWPDVDVTIVELGILARKGYEDKMAVAVTGLMARINS